MNNQIQIFESAEFGKVRVITIDGQPWFVGKDIAGNLGYERADNAIRLHVDSEDKLTHQISASGQNRNMVVVNESGLYSLILSSKLPSAKRFKRWVTKDVLPTIRKHGAYATPGALDEMLRSPKFTEALIRSLAEERKRSMELEDTVDRLAPKARYCDVILQSRDAVPVSLIAKDYGMSATAFNRLLYGFAIQYPTGGTWLLYQDFAGRGYTHTRTYHVGETTTAMHTCWTQKGRLFLYKRLKHWGFLPLIEKMAVREG